MKKNIITIVAFTMSILSSVATADMVQQDDFYPNTYEKSSSTIGKAKISIRKIFSVRMIAIIVPNFYSAEQQAINFICKAANNLGIDCSVFSYDDNSNFLQEYKAFISLVNPNIVINYGSEISFFKDKHDYFTLGIANIDRVRNTKNKEWFSFYDKLLISGKDISWFKDIFKNYDKIDDDKIIEFYNSPPQSSSFFEPRKREKLFYPGSNWDSTRKSDHYKKIFTLLDDKEYLQVYGPADRWNFLKNSYKGADYSLDGFLKKMQNAGVTLVLQNIKHLKANNPAALRVFEAASAGNVIISDRMKFYEEEFGDCIFYIDPSEEPQKVVNKIDNIMQWVEKNPELADQKAKCVYDIYIKKYSMETQLLRIIEEYKKFEGKNLN